MRCWSVRRKLSAFIDGELARGPAERIEAHVAACEACAERLRRMRAAWEEVARLPAPAAGDDLWPGILAKLVEGDPTAEPDRGRSRFLVPATVAACALAGIALGGFAAVRLLPRSTARPPIAAASSDDSFAEAFADLPGEEEMHP